VHPALEYGLAVPHRQSEPGGAAVGSLLGAAAAFAGAAAIVRDRRA